MPLENSNLSRTLSFAISLLCSSLLILLSSSCARPKTAPAADAFSQIVYQPHYARGFRILGAPGRHSTILEITDPWQGASGITQQLLIARAGEEPPADFLGPVIRPDSDGVRLIAMSSSHVAMLSALGCADSIVGISGLRFIHDPAIRARAPRIAEIGYEGAVDYEAILAARPSLVLLYGVNGADPIESKLRSLAIPYIYIGDYVEQSPLGKAEWVVALGEICLRRDKALALFNPIPMAYHALADSIKHFPGPKPRVMVNTPYADSWFMPPVSSYLVRLITDAGGQYVYPQNTSSASVAVPLEQAYLLASKADRWLNVGAHRSLAEVAQACPRFTDIPAFRNRQVFNDDRRRNTAGGNDYWESGVMAPHKVLRDFAIMLYPSQFPDSSLTYYRRLQ